MTKTFTRVGISTNKGKTQFRYTNDLNRETVLSKNGHTDIVFYELGEALTKEQASEVMSNILAQAASGALEATPDDGFVEPKDEAVQVAMCQAARDNPTLDAQALFMLVTAPEVEEEWTPENADYCDVGSRHHY